MDPKKHVARAHGKYVIIHGLLGRLSGACKIRGGLVSDGGEGEDSFWRGLCEG